MLPPHLADRLLKQRRAEESAEFARQLPLYVEDPAYLHDPEQDGETPRREPDWATNY